MDLAERHWEVHRLNHRIASRLLMRSQQNMAARNQAPPKKLLVEFEGRLLHIRGELKNSPQVPYAHLSRVETAHRPDAYFFWGGGYCEQGLTPCILCNISVLPTA